MINVEGGKEYRPSHHHKHYHPNYHHDHHHHHHYHHHNYHHHYHHYHYLVLTSDVSKSIIKYLLHDGLVGCEHRILLMG